VEESVRLLLKKQHPVKRQPHSATILKRWRGEESPSVYGGEDVNRNFSESIYSSSPLSRESIEKAIENGTLPLSSTV
jgi:hypothetical protein